MAKKSVKNTPRVKSSSGKSSKRRKSHSNNRETNYFLIGFWIIVGLMIYDTLITSIPQETKAEWYELY